MADTYDITIDAGSTYQLSVLWKDDSAVAINLTGYSARMHIRREIDDETTILELSSGSGLTLGGSAGTVAVEIAATDTVDLSGVYVYDLEVESGGGVVTRLIQGVITINPEVTRE
jgi:hypothetical protein